MAILILILIVVVVMYMMGYKLKVEIIKPEEKNPKVKSEVKNSEEK